MPYHYFCLRLKNQDRAHAETFRLRKTLQNLKLTFMDRKFSGEDLILIFDFLT